MSDSIDELDALAKGEARGGKYHRRVTQEGKHRYYYSPEAYARAHGDDAHISGADVLRGKAMRAAKKSKRMKKHPASEAQRRWAFVAEERGELPKGKALEWSRRVKAGTAPMSKSEGTMDAIEGLTKLVKGGEQAGHKYLSRKPDGRGGWTYQYSHEGEAVPHPTKLNDAHDHVAHALHSIGAKSGEHLSVHVASQDEKRPASEAGKYHTVAIKDARGATSSTYTGHPYGVSFGTMSQYTAAPESRAGIKAFEKQLGASSKKHGKAVQPKVKKSSALDAIDRLVKGGEGGARGGKYTSRKYVGGRWRYTYDLGTPDAGAAAKHGAHAWEMTEKTPTKAGSTATAQEHYAAAHAHRVAAHHHSDGGRLKSKLAEQHQKQARAHEKFAEARDTSHKQAAQHGSGDPNRSHSTDAATQANMLTNKITNAGYGSLEQHEEAARLHEEAAKTATDAMAALHTANAERHRAQAQMLSQRREQRQADRKQEASDNEYHRLANEANNATRMANRFHDLYGKSSPDTVRQHEAAADAHMQALALARQTGRKGLADIHVAHVKTHRAKAGYSYEKSEGAHPMIESTPSIRKSFRGLDGAQPLAKGLYKFGDYSPNAKMQSIPDEYLLAYLDAFIEEATEHEMREKAHALEAMTMGPTPGGPEDSLAQWVLNELVQYMACNANLMRAVKMCNCTKSYIADRIREMGLLKPLASHRTDHGDYLQGYMYSEEQEAGYVGKSYGPNTVLDESAMLKAVAHSRAAARAVDGAPMQFAADDPMQALGDFHRAQRARVQAYYGEGTARFDAHAGSPLPKR